MLAPTFPAPADAGQEPSGLQLLLLENIVDENILAARIAAAAGQPAEQLHPSGPLYPARTPLHRQLIALCLHNPYWSDFRLLHHFHRRNIPLTMADLLLLKNQSGLANRESICNTLIKLSDYGGLKLNDRQLRFIEKNKPEYRDRDLAPSQPGELLVHECLFGRGFGNLGRVYVHFFIDMFTGYAFGEVSQQRSLTVGLKVLLDAIQPVYRAHNYPIHTVLHSSRVMNDIKEYNQLEAAETFSGQGLHWVPTRRKFGAIEKFEKSALASRFLEIAARNAASLATIQPVLQQCLLKYNAANRLFSRRDLLEE